MPQQHIGSVINPGWAYDLESSLKLQRMLVERARADEWRFRGPYVTTGPYETMMGASACGSSCSKYSDVELDLPFSNGLASMVDTARHGILCAMCDYPEFARLDEPTWDTPFAGAHCGDAVKRLAALEGKKTVRSLNGHWKRARVVRDVRLVCGWGGIHFDADISFNLKPCESRWGVFWLLKRPLPRWSERGRLATWLEKCADMLEGIIAEGEA
jgi:hypothetical protein